VETRICRDDEDVASRGFETVEFAFDLGNRIMGRVVQHQGHERGDRLQTVLADRFRPSGRLLRKPALRAELGRGDSQFRHLGENFLGIELVAPSRHFTYAPTYGCGSDSHDFLPILRGLCSDAYSSAAASP